MKLAKATLTLLAVISWSAAASAFDFDRGSFGERFATQNCAWCHGTSLQGFSTAPRLAGQRAEYIESQMRDLREHGRDNPKSKIHMWGAARAVSPETAHQLGLYLASLTPKSAMDGDRGLEERGRAIYRDGEASANVPSCVVCHGPEGQGAGAIPRIGGLAYRYLKRRLGQWGEGYHASAKFPMPAVATNLSAEEIDALSSYLSFVQ
jgi:cytochrome c553